MSRWFRHYAGMMRDEKLVTVAIRSKQSVERVVWVWGAILESAAEIDDAGRFEVDAAEVAYFLRADETDILNVMDALEQSGRIAASCVVKWGDRQYQSDKSVERQARYRERQRAKKSNNNEVLEACDVTVTSRDGVVTPQETDTETETDNTSSLRSEVKARAPAKTRGSRLPDDFNPDLEFAMSEGLTAFQAEREAAQFRDYWMQQAGQKGVKLDWPATWRTWVRNTIKRMPSQNTAYPQKQNKPRTVGEAAVERIKENGLGNVRPEFAEALFGRNRGRNQHGSVSAEILTLPYERHG